MLSCEKEDSLNKLPDIPVLLEPQTGSVINNDTINFKWQCTDSENDEILYTLYISEDSINWEEKTIIDDPSHTLYPSGDLAYWDYYVFEKGKKYYWKVKAENYFSDNDPAQESGESISEISYFYRTPPGVYDLRVSSGHEFVNLYWNYPENLDHVEITFEPAVSGIDQPVIINAGTGKCEFTGLENGTIYSFFIKTYNTLNHVSETDTIKALPLNPIQVHDADFNIYNITQIGEQTWLRENLRTTKWQDGTPLVNDYGWKLYKIGSQSEVYGYYYAPYSTFGEGAQGKNPCPCGYHVPSDDEWKELERYLEMPEDEIDDYCDYTNKYRGEELNIGNILKSTSGWLDYNGENGNGTDFYGFNLLPAGFIYQDEEVGFGETSILVSSIFVGGTSIFKFRGFSNQSGGIRYCQTLTNCPIRCIKD